MANQPDQTATAWWHALPRKERDLALSYYDAINGLRLSLTSPDTDLESMRLSKYEESSTSAWAVLTKALNNLRSRIDAPGKRKFLRQAEELVELARRARDPAPRENHEAVLGRSRSSSPLRQ